MRRVRAWGLFLACACAWLVVPASASAATIDCSPATNPAANVWIGADGAPWSGAANWSQGSVPDAADDACVGLAAMDVDVDVRSLQSGGLLVPAGRRLTLRAAAGGTLRIDGTLAAVGTVDGTTLEVTGRAGGQTTIDVEGSLLLSALEGVRDLSLPGPGELHINSGSTYVSGSISGHPAAGITTSMLEVGAPGTRNSVAVDVTGRVGASFNLYASGDVTFSGAISGAYSIYASNGTLTLLGAVTSASTVYFGGGVRVDGDALLTAPGIAVEDGELWLKSCRLSASVVSVGTFMGNIRVDDLGCIDPPPGMRRYVGHETTLWLDSEPRIRITSSGRLSAGGTLVLSGIVEVAAGTELTDAATTVTGAGGYLFIGVSGPGTANIVDLFSGTPDFDPQMQWVEVRALDGQTLQITNPRHPAHHICFQVASSVGTGSIVVRDPEIRPYGCAAQDVASAGAAPIRYEHAGIAYEPQRSVVQLDGGSWTPAGLARVTNLSGHGALFGSIQARSVTSDSGTLRIVGGIDADLLGFSLLGVPGSLGVLDLTGATTQRIGDTVGLYGPLIPATAAHGDSWVIAPGLRNAPAVVTPYRISLPPGLTWRVSAVSGELRVVDAVVPGLPLDLVSASHAPAAIDSTIDAGWGAAPDGGIAPVSGYAVSWTQSATSLAGRSVTTSITSATSPVLDAGFWWVHVAAIDSDGNVGPTTHSVRLEVLAPPVELARLDALPATTWTAHAVVRWSVPGTAPLSSQVVEVATSDFRGRVASRSTTTVPVSARAFGFTVTPGRRTCVRVLTASPSGPAASAPRCTMAPLDDRALPSRGFTATLASWAHRGTLRTSVQAGSTLAIPLLGTRSITLVATKCTSCGAVRITRGGVLVASVSLRALETTRAGRVTIRIPTGDAGAPLLLTTMSARMVRVDAVVPYWP